MILPCRLRIGRASLALHPIALFLSVSERDEHDLYGSRTWNSSGLSGWPTAPARWLRSTSNNTGSYWLASAPHPVIGLVTAEAVNWATQLQEVTDSIDGQWSIAPTDAFYDVAAARTTLRARRDVIVDRGETRVILRLRSGSPGKSAGPGLRADLTIDALADHDGRAPSRLIGLWPEAGVCLCVDGTMTDLRAGARDLVRTAVAQRRQDIPMAA